MSSPPPSPADDESLSLKDLRFGARFFSAVAAMAGVGYVLTPFGVWQWMLGAIAVVCFVRSIIYFSKARRLQKEEP